MDRDPMRLIELIKRYQCPHCKKRFLTSDGLLMHNVLICREQVLKELANALEEARQGLDRKRSALQKKGGE